ncbi:MAG: hypothetical protein CMJ58_08000 [Planctomycetaceae bacterium]|nr:hypothetical protein [Planctomycetaceae bacterium]
MPASEQTWYNQKLLHIVFAVSAVLMAVATIWLVAKDQNREWKDIQLDDRQKDAWMLQARHDFLEDQYSEKTSEYETELKEAKTQPIDPELILDFKTAKVGEDDRLSPGDAGSTSVDDDPSFAGVDAALEQFNQAATVVAERKQDIADASESAAEAATRQYESAVDAALDAREDLMDELQVFINEAKRRETQLVARKKAVNGARTAAVSKLGLLQHESASNERIGKVQSEIDGYDSELVELTAEIAAAKTYRLKLESIVAEMNAEEAEIAKELSAIHSDLARLAEQIDKNTSNLGEWITRLPVLSALYNGNIRIDQIWLPELTINYNFSQVARFDRCTTCHRAIAKTVPGTASEPLYPTIPDGQREFAVALPTPDQPDDEQLAESEPADLVRELYGLQLSDSGIIDDADVTVQYVRPETPAAIAGLQPGDVILTVAGATTYSPEAVHDQLLKFVDWESEAEIKVRRGLNHPYTAHPRLDLYLTDLSPHPQKDFGCTICHDGQGSGTEFKWVSHTPNNWNEQEEWIDKHGWFDNHHWIFPMKPARFAESNCLKCHHDKGGLEPSEKFPEPPAPKLVEGWKLVEDYGCYGCHEVNGYNGPDQRIGPDVRLEPAFHEAAQQILQDESLTDEQRRLAEALVASPDNDAARHELMAEINADEALGADDAELSPATHALAAVLKDVDAPGVYRKAGPSLRHVSSKVDFDWLYSWIRKPADFRPTTKMPQFFLQYEHLTEEGDEEELHESMTFEPIEIFALSEFLLNNSVDFEYLEQPESVTEDASPDRGKWLFETRGCLACHAHEEFDGIAADQGPDLSRIAAKLNTERGQKWLYSWLKQPHRYHLRTVMPVLYLDPIEEIGDDGQPTGKVTDPAADIVAYLLSIETDWKPTGIPQRELSSDQQEALAQLAVEWLQSDTIPEAKATAYVNEGVPDHLASKLKADERVLLGMTPANRVEKQLEFVARRTIGKYGCFGCHDIPGYESAKPIGTAIADWGRKESSKLAFENIGVFLARHGIDPEIEVTYGENGELNVADVSKHESHGDGHAAHLDPSDEDYTNDESYFVQALNSHSRDGFAWQKLRYPRSYDYKTTRNKSFNERLRMPKFPFDDEQREAVMTFLLGLVSEPPADAYVYTPDAQQQAIVDGRQVLERFNCAGCHTLKMEQWEFAYHEDDFGSASKLEDYPFLAPEFSAREIATSLVTDERGMLHATLHGMPVLEEDTGEPTWVDEDREPLTKVELLEYEAEEGEEIPVFWKFTLWDDALVSGEPRLMGVEQLMIPADRDQYGPAHGTAYPAWGGDLARYLFPRVIEWAQQTNPQVNGKEAWGWLPPPLMNEGEKVQSDWLHAFLMDPGPLRPAVVMRMPNFKMSSDEAAKLANYFAAANGAEFPYQYRQQQSSSYLAGLSGAAEDNKLDEAMNIVVSGNYCVKCHAVSDFMPKGDVKTFGPRLSDVYRRLRPEYVRDWVANPARILPYTGMPVNIPYRPGEEHLGGVSQDLFHGTSVEQLYGLVDLLMNFDAYAKQQTDVSSLVQDAAGQVGSGEDGAESSAGGQ